MWHYGSGEGISFKTLNIFVAGLGFSFLSFYFKNLNNKRSILFSCFFINFWRTQVLFVWAHIPLFWTSGDVCPEFQSQGRTSHLRTSLATCSGFLRFTFGATPADLFATGLSGEIPELR